MVFTKKTIVVREAYYERLRREAFHRNTEIKELLDAILKAWAEKTPEYLDQPIPMKAAREDREREAIKSAMLSAHNNREDAARILKISRMNLFNRMKKLGLEFPKARQK